jgi:hypothetical protein
MRVVMMALAALLAAGAAQAASLETYSKQASMHSVSISPDGAKVAFIQRVNGKEAVVIDQLNPAAVLGTIPPGGPYGGLTWVDANHLVAYGPGAAFIVDLEKHKVSRLFEKTDLLAVSGAPITRTRAGHTVVFVTGLTDLSGVGVPTFVAVDINTGKVERLARAHTQTNAEWGLDADGNLIYQAIYDQHTHVWTLQLPRGSGWADTLSVNALYDPPRIVGRTLDGKNLVMERITDDRGLEFRSVSPVDGKVGDLVPEYVGLTSVVYDPQTYLPIGGLKEGVEPNYAFFDPKDQALWDGILKLFPDEEVTLSSWAKDRSKAVVVVTGLKHGASYQVVDTVTHKTMGIGPQFDGLAANDLADIQIATYPAKDGLPIQALLTLPTGRQPKNLPLIVLPHSRVRDRDMAGYQGWVQAFASRGYAVLQPEFRGTFGLGWKLESAGDGEFGRKMQTDMSDGVRALAAQGVIDPKRVCIVGGPGYGGYAALAGVMFEQGVYRCAVAVDPWVDIRKAAGGIDADTKHSVNLRNWDRFVGAKGPSDPVFDQISPSKHAADASAPILIVHARTGADESIDDSIVLVNALHGAKKSAELMPLEGVDPAALDKRRLDQLQAMVTFVEKNNPPN